MPFCPKCGKEVDAEAEYCFYCGQSLPKIQSVPVELKAHEAPAIKREVPPPPKTHRTRNIAIVAFVVIVIIAAAVVLFDPNILNSLGSGNAPSVSIQTIDGNPQAYVGKTVTVTGQIGFNILVAAGNTGYSLTSGGYSIALFGNLPYGFTPTIGNSYTVMGTVEQYSVPFFGTGYDIQVSSIS